MEGRSKTRGQKEEEIKIEKHVEVERDRNEWRIEGQDEMTGGGGEESGNGPRWSWRRERGREGEGDWE